MNGSIISASARWRWHRDDKPKVAYWCASRSTIGPSAAWVLVFACFTINGVNAQPVDLATSAVAKKTAQIGLPIDKVTRPLPGPLLFTPAERATLDAQRKRGEVVVEGKIVEAPRPPVTNGFVKRSDGSSVVWIDGAAHNVSGLISSKRLLPDLIGEESRVSLKPGAAVATTKR